MYSKEAIEKSKKEGLLSKDEASRTTDISDMIPKTEQGVTAEEYWENYFKEHPEERPAHIIYYDGQPEDAIRKMRKEYGFQDKQSVTEREKIAIKEAIHRKIEKEGDFHDSEKERFMGIASKMIVERFIETPKEELQEG